MGKAWDRSGIAYDVAMWRGVYRVLKPGAHLLAFGGSRTYHRLACAIEDAGFEIRDQMQWLYGSGFPKSLDISKGIDKNDGRAEFVFERHQGVVALKEKLIELFMKSGKSKKQIDEECGFHACDYLRIKGSSPFCNVLPSPDKWIVIKKIIGGGDDVCLELDSSFAGAEREVIAIGKSGSNALMGGLTEDNNRGQYNITTPATDLARQWDGWGTALKPAHEPICVARKPLEGTVVQNVLKHGCGGINVKGCRIGYENDGADPATNPLYRKQAGYKNQNSKDDGSSNFALKDGSGERNPDEGRRWPSNIIHDGSDEVLACFPDSKGQQGDVRGTEASRPGGERTACYGEYGRVPAGKWGNSGSAARFFYAAKASQEERNLGCEGLAKQSCGMMKDNNYPIKTGSGNLRDTKRRNTHPTVKPLALMCYLVRLVTPPGGVVLDHFMGSGSTLIAAGKEGLDAVGIDSDAESCRIAEARCRGHLGMLVEITRVT